MKLELNKRHCRNIKNKPLTLQQLIRMKDAHSPMDFDQERDWYRSLLNTNVQPECVHGILARSCMTQTDIKNFADSPGYVTDVVSATIVISYMLRCFDVDYTKTPYEIGKDMLLIPEDVYMFATLEIESFLTALTIRRSIPMILKVLRRELQS